MPPRLLTIDPGPVEKSELVEAGRPRLHVLDGMRLAAAVGVMGYHFVGRPAGGSLVWRGAPWALMPRLQAVAAYGWLGVDLFFLISGFVICMSCWGRRPQDFIASRVARLYPAYWASLAATSATVLVAGYSFSTARTLTPRDLLANATMLQNPLGAAPADPSYWTLWVEMVFYATFLAVVAVGITYRSALAFCGIWTALAVVSPSAKFPLLTLVCQPACAPFFIAGIIMYLMHRFGPNLLLGGMLALTWSMAVEGLRSAVGAFGSGLPRHLSPTVATLLVSGFFLLVLGAALGWFDRARWRWLSFAGSLSYPLYLLHQEIGTTAIHWLRGSLDPYTTLSIVTSALVLLAWLVQRFVERPVARLMKKGLAASFAAVTSASMRAAPSRQGISAPHARPGG